MIIGAGAAGLMCAATAARRGRRTLLLEHTNTVGAKIVISGGGRCNFTNLYVSADRFLSENPRFARSALARYTAQDFLALVRAHGIPFYEKTLGQLFCEGVGSAKRIVRMLQDECAAAGAEVRCGVETRAVVKTEAFRLETSRGDLRCESLVVATGGLSIPKLGATDFAFRLARQFALAIVPPRPGLVPLVFDGEEGARIHALAGVAAPARVKAASGPAFEEAALFTHRGMSGPAILQASSYWRPGEAIEVDFFAADPLGPWLQSAKRARPQAKLAGALSERAPQRLAATLAGDDPRPLADWRDRDLAAFAARVSPLRLTPAGDEGYAKAEVTAGGVSTAALDQKTMMAKSVPGLFIVGEAVDVTGWLGGYNFQWAWSSGWAAGMAA